MNTTIPKVDEIERRWLVVDAEGMPLGRLAVRVANLLRGRTKPTYTPHLDTGDFVVVVNAAKVALSGRKEEKKIYQRFTGYRDGLKTRTAAVQREHRPETMIEQAVHGMLPRNRQARQTFRRLHVYAGSEHPHQAQKPESVKA